MSEHYETLVLTPDELCSLVQGLWAQICNRMYWMLTPSHPIRETKLIDHREVLHSMTQAYSKAMMVALDSDQVAQIFKERYVLSQTAWDTLLEIDRARAWREVPVHKHNSPLTCPLCEELILAV